MHFLIEQKGIFSAHLLLHAWFFFFVNLIFKDDWNTDRWGRVTSSILFRPVLLFCSSLIYLSPAVRKRTLHHTVVPHYLFLCFPGCLQSMDFFFFFNFYSIRLSVDARVCNADPHKDNHTSSKVWCEGLLPWNKTWYYKEYSFQVQNWYFFNIYLFIYLNTVVRLHVELSYMHDI